MRQLGHVVKAAEADSLNWRREERIVHAWAHNSVVSLCGRVRKPDAPVNGVGHKCAKCLREAGRKDFMHR